ncbi:uncharacterized protein LOC125501154 isoform X4 [Athalia rosae]|uniref:uncharacterized protein LOC125501154 isoform X4 n=1 Tax=Athalia rosae TaxID=37344 RepID=UPI002033F921|nr:uncharacterized protein LOC125501154 isoform X4 [Athalia rosae]
MSTLGPFVNFLRVRKRGTLTIRRRPAINNDNFPILSTAVGLPRTSKAEASTPQTVVILSCSSPHFIPNTSYRSYLTSYALIEHRILCH